MDWHTDMDDYITAKQQLFRWQKPEDIAIYYAKNEYPKRIAEVSSAKKIPYFESHGAVIENEAVKIDGQEICKVNDIKLLGKHNWQNVCAAVTASWQVTQNVKAIKSAITSFT